VQTIADNDGAILTAQSIGFPEGSGGANFYALHDNDAAHSFAWDLGVTYSRPYSFFGNPENEVNFSASYTADAEYFTFVDERGPASARFKPLPATDHEIHAFNVKSCKNGNALGFVYHQ